MTMITRRQMLAGLAGIGASALATPAFVRSAHAAMTHTDLASIRIMTRQIEVKGRAATVYGLLTPNGVSGLTLNREDGFALRLENAIADPSLIHWHGLTPPWRDDGVPDISQPLLAPGASYDYRFALRRAGTHWMHSHHGLQEQQLMAAPLIIHDAKDRKADMQEVVVMLHDFSFADPMELLEKLRGGSGHGPMGHGAGHGSGHNMGGMAGAMNTMPGNMMMDLNDIDHDAYLANDRTLDDPEIIATERGGMVRLRVINGGASTSFTLDLGRVTGTLVAVDGNPVAPLTGSQFPIAIAQRLDIVLRMPDDGDAVPVLALREGARERTGIILQPVGANLRKIDPTGTIDGPVVGLDLETRLRNIETLADRPADRHITVDLTGTMAGYVWGMAIDGVENTPVRVRAQDRVEITFRNPSMMSHPMHLHGHHFQVAAINGVRLNGAMRDTVMVPPRQTVTIAFDADNPGKWAFHCHHMYHMATGMMTTLEYDGIA
ncbi:MAG: multicopper oxidase family protein [Pseudomonadota bacterium]